MGVIFPYGVMTNGIKSQRSLDRLEQFILFLRSSELDRATLASMVAPLLEDYRRSLREDREDREAMAERQQEIHEPPRPHKPEALHSSLSEIHSTTTTSEIDEASIYGLPAATTTTAAATTDSIKIMTKIQDNVEIRAPPESPKPEAPRSRVSNPIASDPIEQLPVEEKIHAPPRPPKLEALHRGSSTPQPPQVYISQPMPPPPPKIPTKAPWPPPPDPVAVVAPPPPQPPPLPHNQLPPQLSAIRPPAPRRLQFARWRGRPCRGRLRRPGRGAPLILLRPHRHLCADGHGTRRTPPRRPHPLPHHQLPPPPRAIRPPARRRLRFVRQRGQTRRGRLRHGARRAAIRAPDPPAARRRLQVATHCKTLSTSMAHARCSSNCVREMVELPDGGTQFEVMVPHPRSDLYMDLLALKKLDAMLLSMVGMYAGRKLSKSYVKLDAMLLSMFGMYAGRKLSKSYADVGLLSYVRGMFDEMAEQDFISCSLMDIAAIRFTKPLLEEDMSSSSKGLCTALAITFYKIIAEKDDIVKAAMELKNAGIKDGYTAEVSSCRYAPLVVVVSPRGCEGELYCSQSCADSDWDSSHSFLSTGSKKEPSWRSALWIFVDILLVAAKAITYNTLRYKKLKTHRPSQDKHGEASCSIGFKTRWWECIALLDDVAFIGMLNTCHHAGIVDCGKEPEVAHVRLLFSEGFFLSSRVTKILCSEATVEQDQAAMRLLGASQLINHRVSDALSGLLLVEAILQYKG